MNQRYAIVLIVISIFLASGIPLVSAHDTETVNGYEITFGGSDEPVITDERMWLEVNVVDTESEEPIEGLEESLTIAVQRPFGNDTRELDVSSRFGAPGWYEAPIIFTQPGTYTVYINGTFDGADANLAFQKQVHNASNLQYPPQTPTANTDQSSTLTEGVSGIIVGAGIAVVGMAIAFVAARQF